MAALQGYAMSSIKIWSYFPRTLVVLCFVFLNITAISFLRSRWYNKSIAPLRPLPETPFSLIHTTGLRSRPSIPSSHSCIHIARLMAYTHNTILRGLNAIYHHAPNVTLGTSDASSFLLYCRTVCDFLQLHHETEEEFFFPAIEKASRRPGLMNGNIKQHEAFEEQVRKLSEYTAITTAEKFQPQTLRLLIEDTVKPLGQHLHEEIPTLLDLWDKVDSSSLSKAYKAMHDAAEKRSDPFRYLIVNFLFYLNSVILDH